MLGSLDVDGDVEIEGTDDSEGAEDTVGNVETLGKEDKVRWLDTDGAIDNDGTALLGVDGANIVLGSAKIVGAKLVDLSKSHDHNGRLRLT